MRRTMSSTLGTLWQPPGFPQLAGNVLIKYQGSCLKNYFSLPLSELELVLSQLERRKKKNEPQTHSGSPSPPLLKSKKKKMYLKIMQGSGLWKMVCLQAGLFFLLLFFLRGLFDLSC